MSQPAPQATWPAEPTTDPGNKPNAAQPIPNHPNPDAVEHAQIGTDDKKEGAKDMGLVHAPVVSLHPTSEKQGEADAEIGDHQIIDAANIRLNHSLPDYSKSKLIYPFEALDIDRGMFIPVEKGSTTDKLMSNVYKQVDQYRKQNSEVERDEDGDDVMEDVAINKKQRNEDGTVRMDGDVPRLGIKSGFRPKLIGPNFVVKAVVKGDKIGENDEADRDGALVIRVG